MSAKNNPVLRELWKSLRESLVSVLPVSGLVFLLSVTPWVDISGKELTVFGIAALLLIVGISLFNLGADMAMTPMGQYIGEGLTKSRKLGILLSVSFVMGLLITVAGPDLAVLARQVSAVMDSTLLIVTVAPGTTTTRVFVPPVPARTCPSDSVTSPVSGVSVYGRGTQGVRIMRLSEGSRVISLAEATPEPEESGTEETGTEEIGQETEETPAEVPEAEEP